ncbi:MAG: peptidylprolyl isomerase [Dehalococcoidia bacterium]|nr:peptidylprolyl isomerase [Dehalococcoidia bacterium]
MNILGSPKVFGIVGIVVVIVFLVGAVYTSGANDRSAADPLPTATPAPSVTASASSSASVSASPTPLQFAAAEQVIDAATKKYEATILTSKGEIKLRLLADQAPLTVNTFVFLARKQYFDGIIFHRVVKDFVIQAGDPTGTGRGGPGFETAEDKNELTNKRGFVSMAKAGAVTKFGSQFFINLKDNPALDQNTASQKRFYPWAEVIAGMEIVDQIALVRVDQAGKPVEPVVIQSVLIIESAK